MYVAFVTLLLIVVVEMRMPHLDMQLLRQIQLISLVVNVNCDWQLAISLSADSFSRVEVTGEFCLQIVNPRLMFSYIRTAEVLAASL